MLQHTIKIKFQKVFLINEMMMVNIGKLECLKKYNG